MILAFLLALAAPPPMLDPTGSAKEDTAKPRPDGNPGAWFTTDDYPVAARQANASGAVRFTVDVDERGVPVNCVVTESSGAASLDDGTCALVMQRGHFIPGHDAAGMAIPGQFSSRVKWTSTRASGGAGLLSFVGGDHQRCSYARDGATKQIDPALCAALAKDMIAGGKSLDAPIAVTLSGPFTREAPDPDAPKATPPKAP